VHSACLVSRAHQAGDRPQAHLVVLAEGRQGGPEVLPPFRTLLVPDGEVHEEDVLRLRQTSPAAAAEHRRMQSASACAGAIVNTCNGVPGHVRVKLASTPASTSPCWPRVCSITAHSGNPCSTADTSEPGISSSAVAPCRGAGHQVAPASHASARPAREKPGRRAGTSCCVVCIPHQQGCKLLATSCLPHVMDSCGP